MPHQYSLHNLEIPIGDSIDEDYVRLFSNVEDPDGDTVKLQVELRRVDEYNGQFDETKGGLKESLLVSSGSIANIEVYDLIRGRYHWRARAIDDEGAVSEWQDFGNNGISEPDFNVCNKFKIIYPNGWMNLQLFVPFGYSPVGYLDKIRFDVFNRRDMWYKIIVSRSVQGGDWKDITSQIWTLPYVGPYSHAPESLLYTPIGGEQIRIELRDDRNDGILCAMKVLDLLARAVIGKPLPSQILNVNVQTLWTFHRDVYLPMVGGVIASEFWDFIKNACIACIKHIILENLASIYIDRGLDPIAAAEIIFRINKVASLGVDFLVKITKFVIVSKDLFSNMWASPSQQESVVLTVDQRLTSTMAPNLILTGGLETVQAGPFIQGDKIGAHFTLKNMGVLPVNFHSLAIGGRTEEGSVQDFPFHNDVTINPGETYTYQGELTLLDEGQYCFFVALQLEDNDWIIDVPAETGLNTIYVDSDPLLIAGGAILCSPGELRVYDDQGRVTGLVNGKRDARYPIHDIVSILSS